MLLMPVIVLFYQSNNLSMSEIMLIQSIYSISIVFFEIPSGYAADIWGRKKTIMLGSVLGFMGYLIYSFSDDFYGFLFAEIVLGIAQSFISGADSALLYDTLLQKKRSSEYTKYEGRITSIGNLAESLAGIIGGFLATYSIFYPVYFQSIVAFVAIPASFFLVETSVKSNNKKPSLKDFLTIIKSSLWNNKPVFLNIMFSSIIGASTLTLAWFAQPVFIKIELPLTLYGIMWTLLNLTVGITSLMLFQIQKKISNLSLNIIIAFGIPLLIIIIALNNSYWVILPLFIFYLLRGIATPLLKDALNKICASEIRATVLSIRGFIIRILFSAFAPILGWANDVYSLSAALLLAGSIFLVSAGITFFAVYKIRQFKDEPDVIVIPIK
jgi:MFS family permease